jgi:hypothetical protein
MNAHDKTQRFVDDHTRTATAWGDAARGLLFVVGGVAFVLGSIFLCRLMTLMG